MSSDVARDTKILLNLREDGPTITSSGSLHIPQKPRRMLGVSLKMYFTIPAAHEYIHALTRLSPSPSSQQIDFFVIPDFLSLVSASSILRRSPSIILGAQNCFWEDSGAYTGEISPKTLKEAGVGLVELGHAERRSIFGESNEIVAKKAKAAVRNGLMPLVCVGERTRPGRIASQAVGMAVEECRPQVKAVLDVIPDDGELVLAYEPVWAIEQSEPVEADHVVAVCKELKRMVHERKEGCRILYGGSAGPGTFARLKEGIDGLFLGSFAHDVGKLEEVIKEMGRE
ncbi:MAG: hypothetical protein M1836_006531 [Candelina mexicana]|nr:MAG: hypothetical protein M1836_006531 [Candelina mexicana]